MASADRRRTIQRATEETIKGPKPGGIGEWFELVFFARLTSHSNHGYDAPPGPPAKP